MGAGVLRESSMDGLVVEMGVGRCCALLVLLF
jgi:hypothetical protein